MRRAWALYLEQTGLRSLLHGHVSTCPPSVVLACRWVFAACPGAALWSVLSKSVFLGVRGYVNLKLVIALGIFQS